MPPDPLDRDALADDGRAFIDAIAWHAPRKPVVAVLARNEATETTDFLVAHGVLQRSGAAEAHAVAPRRGPVSLYPVFEVESRGICPGFDRNHPDGADFVVAHRRYVVDRDVATTTGRRRAPRVGGRRGRISDRSSLAATASRRWTRARTELPVLDHDQELR